jgi:hypothetical protein
VKRQKDDFYATDPIAVVHLLDLEPFKNVYECACGQGHLSKILIDNGIHGKSTDSIYRGFGEGGVDFLSSAVSEWNGDIITNPPFTEAPEFILKALQIIPKGNKVAMFLRVQFLESQKRKQLFEDYPPKTVYISRSRISCAKDGDFKKHKGGTTAHCWFVWQKGYKEETVLKWFN